jgi:hypothetical protein
LLTLFAVGIPFFGLFIIGLKLLIDNLKSIGSKAKIILAILWVMSLIGLGILGIRQATEQAYDGDVITEEVIPVRSGDTLRIAMRADKQYSYDVSRQGGVHIEYNENDEKIIYSNDIRLIVRHTRDSVGKLLIERSAEGASFLNAKKRAEAINYNYSFDGNKLLLDGFFITDLAQKYRDQEVEVILYLPIGSILYAEDNTYSFHRNNSRYNDILDNGDEEKYLRILEDETECLDCPTKERKVWNDDDDKTNWEKELDQEFGEDENSDRIMINEDGVKINLNDDDALEININN